MPDSTSVSDGSAHGRDPSENRKDRSLSRLAWVVFGFVAVCFVGGVLFSLRIGSGYEPFDAAMMSFPVVGSLVASRHPRNAVGWIMLGIGVVAGVSTILAAYAAYGLDINPGSLPHPEIAVALNEPMWVPFIAPIGTFLILLFPNGQLPSRRWRAWAWLCAASMFLAFVVILFAPVSFAGSGYPNINNPLGIEALGPIINGLSLVIALIPVSILGCAVALVQRFRRSHGQERLQLKWLAAAASVVAIVYALLLALYLPYSFPGSEPPDSIAFIGDVGIFVFVLIPVAVAVAILKYRLYDIDVIINRALVYAGLTAALAVVYIAGVVGLGALVRVIIGQESNNLAVAGSTLAVAGLFGPLRSRVQSFIDRRFYRHKYDAEQTLEDFAAKLRDQVDLDSLNAELMTVVRRTMQPTQVSLWLKPPSVQE